MFILNAGLYRTGYFRVRVYAGIEVGQGMLTREELVKFARSDLGIDISEDQLTRWHKYGILPRPVRLPSNGRAGSLYAYPDFAKENLLLVAASQVSDSLRDLLIDVWLHGGTVDTGKLREIVNKPVKSFGKALRVVDRLFDRVEREVQKGLDHERRARMFPRVSPDDTLATISVTLNVMSSNEEDRIWHASGLEAVTGEEAAGEIADRVLGQDYIRALDSNHAGQSSSDAWDEMKQLFNVNQMADAIRHATSSDFDEVRQFVVLSETVADGLAELTHYVPEPIRLVRFWNTKFVPKGMKRILLIIAVLTLYTQERSKEWVLSAYDAWLPSLDRLKAMTMYSKHMRKHPSLRRRKNWLTYFQACEAVELESIKKHHQLFFEQHPELQAVLITDPEQQ